MKKLFTIIKKQGVALVILVASIYIVKWIVENKRPPGSTTVVEAQSMDMKGMRAPMGVVPVGADYVLERTVGGSELFPATVVALSDEDVVARVPGLVKQVLVYPGDRVVAGQLLATLEADEFDAKALAAMFATDAKQNQAQAASDNLRREQASLSKTEIDVRAFVAAVDVAIANQRAASNSVSVGEGKIREVAAKKNEALAELEYARLDYSREQDLFQGGAISRDDLDKAKKRIDTATAKVAQVDAMREQSQDDLKARRAKKDAAQNMLKQSEARLEGAREAVNVARSMVTSAGSVLAAKKREADAARASADASGTLSSYTELRASDDGVVTDRLVSPGTPVMPGKVVLRVKVDRELRVQTDLPQRLAHSVKVGTVVRISIDDDMEEAQITSVFPFIDDRTRTFRVEAIIPNYENNWQVGSYAEMEVFTSAPVRTLSIRNEAVKTSTDGSHYVWVAFGEKKEIGAGAIYTCTMHPEVEHEGPGDCPICQMPLVPRDSSGSVRAQKRKIEIGPSDLFYTTIIDGLEEGELVTWAGDVELFPGAAIEVVEWDKNGPLTLPEGAGSMPGMEMGDSDMEMGDDDEGMDMPMGGTMSTMEGHEGHTHGPGDNFTCAMHPEVHKSEEGSCPICNMTLVPIEDGA